MANEFTAEELKQVIRAARIFNPGFSEDQFQSLSELEARLADSDYLDTVSGLLKLEKETGIPLSQVFQARDRLLQHNEELEKNVAVHNANMEAAERRLRETEEKHREVVEATHAVETQLEELRHEREVEEKALIAFEQKATEKKERIDEDLAEYRQRADVTEAEIATAGKVKAEVTRHGFSLELALGLAAEFAGYTNACEKLAEALKQHGKLTSHLVALEADIKTIGENKNHMEGILSRLKEERAQHEALLSKLKAEIMEKSELVNFYQRYAHLQSLIEYLGSSHVSFHHCTWCGALFWILRPGNVSKSICKCPWCGLAIVEADRNAYAAVSQSPGTLLKLLP